MTSSSSLGATRQFAIDAAVAGGRVTLDYFRKKIPVTNKESHAFDPVTVADRACEEVIRARIRKEYPDHAIRGEEYGEEGDGEWVWIIDPIDGTRGFICGFLHWGVLLGLLHKEKPVLGVMVQPFTGEVFVGDGQSAHWLHAGETTVMETRNTSALSESIFATTHPRLFTEPLEQAVLERMESEVLLDRYGGDCYHYASLAQGQIDIVIENQLKPWDILPLVPIVRSAGGKLTNWFGGEDLSAGQVVASANEALHSEVLSVIDSVKSNTLRT